MIVLSINARLLLIENLDYCMGLSSSVRKCVLLRKFHVVFYSFYRSFSFKWWNLKFYTYPSCCLS